ncbi:MAG: tyrosinase family protein [Pseudoruegeria sp.]
MAGIRKDIAKLSGPWAPELWWYARAVAGVRQRDANDRKGWRYLAAIHGINIPGWVSQGIIGSASDLPSQGEQDAIFNQCQHAGWFFPPWHRGYLAAFEAILDEWIQDNGGPSDWALPYWNYLNASANNARDIPQEFLDPTLPDGTPNALSDAARGGASTLGPQPWLPRDITLAAQTARAVYTAAPGTLGYGGAISGFAHQGDLTGALEGNPHNLVHVMLGGPGDGWMSDPDFAALDPIFWMHHGNIDRLWEAWMSDGAHSQELGGAWQNGPFPQQFLMPNLAGGADVFTPGQTLPGGPLAPVYDDIHDGTGIVAPVVLALGAGMSVTPSSSGTAGPSALAGANDAAISVAGEAVAVTVPIRTAASSSVAGFALPTEPQVFVNLEGVRGKSASGVLEIYLKIPAADGAAPTVELADTLVFFGLAKASVPQGRHAGNGLTMAADITDIVNKAHADLGVTLSEIEVELRQPGEYSGEITVDRVSIFYQ